MFATLRNAWKIEDIRKRILFTLFILLLFRIGSAIPVPFLNASAMQAFLSDSTTIFSYFNMLTGGAFSQATVFAMSISPYINASIIIQLLTIAIPALERLAKEGEEGKKKLNMYTKILTVVLGLVQGTGYYLFLANNNCVQDPNFFTAAVVVLTFTAGTAVLMWLADQVNSKGIGNGISVILFAGIVARLPSAVWELGRMVSEDMSKLVSVIVVLIMFVGIVILVIYEQQGQRKIPVHYAKRVVGRKMYGGQNTYIPFKLNPSGVMPVIFASSFLTFPLQIATSLAPNVRWLNKLANFLTPTGWAYNIILIVLIVFFAYFYTQVSLNPTEIAKNIRENGGSIPGIRPDKTEEYLQKVLNRLILPGSLYLAVIAVIPTVIQGLFGLPQSISMLMGGTSLLILVGVDLDTMSQIESLLKMHHHEGLVKKGKLRSRNL